MRIMNFRRVRFSNAAATLLLLGIGACSFGRGGHTSVQDAVEKALARGDTNRAIHVMQTRLRRNDFAPEEFMRLGALYRSRKSITARLHSQQVLEHGLQKYPDHAGILLEMGKTLYQQTFYPDAERCFTRVTELDWSICEAHYYLGLRWFNRWKHVQVYEEYLSGARLHFERTVACFPDNIDAFFKLAFTTFALGEAPRADSLCRELLVRDPSMADAHFLLGVIAYEKDEYEECRKAFDRALRLLTEEERDDILEISILLVGEMQEDYDDSSAERRRELRRVFWIERDPDPTTELNERLLEHIYRMIIADLYYAHRNPPLRGWETERGKVLVKLGRPSGIRSTLAGASLEGRKEIWTFARGDWFYQLVFQDQFLNGRYIIPIHFDSDASVLYHAPQKSSYLPEAALIPGAIDVITFRNGMSSSVVYLALEVDLDSLGGAMNIARADQFVARTAFFDGDWKRHLNRVDTLSADGFDRHERAGYDSYPIVRSFDVPFDIHRVAFCLEDDLAATQTVLKAAANTLPYLESNLILSDILFHRERPRSATEDRVVRNDREFFPNPRHDYPEKEKLLLYLEIYNLRLSKARSEYEITYSIFDAPEKRRSGWSKIKRGIKRLTGFAVKDEPVISQTLERRGTDHRANEDLAIDIKALDDGDFVLQVAVLDRISGEKTLRTANFTKISGTNR
jgi:GWxTD domain-containing protein